jgi:poly(3-hydroxybutyrate) depolymerase
MATERTSTSRSRRRLSVVGAFVVLLVAALSNGSAAGAPQSVRAWTIHYTAHNGADRVAVVLLPAWYGPANNPPLPVVISPHGRNGTARGNAKYWGALPAIGRFAVINPDGMGRRLALKSYAYRGQIDDLATMPDVAIAALPWLRLDRERVFALGSSMGGHETLMLVARHPRLLAGAAALDSVTNLPRRYHQLPDVPCDRACLKRWGKPYGLVLQAAMRDEVGGTPNEAPRAYAARSPLHNAEAIVRSGVPLQLWWSRRDRIVTDQQHQSGVLLRELRRLDACAPVSALVGSWEHSKEMKSDQLLPIALIGFGLLPARFMEVPSSVDHRPAPACSVDGR